MRSIPIALTLCCAAPLALAAPGGAIPFKQDPAGGPWSGAGLALLIVSLIAIAVVLVVRKRIGLAPDRAAPRMLRIVESQRLGPRALLSVVEYKGEHYLMSYSEQGVTCLVPPRAGDGA